MSHAYYVKRDETVSGPYTGTQVRQMVAAALLEPADLISGDQANWKQAGAISALFPSVAKGPPSAPVATGATPPGPPDAELSPTVPPPPGAAMPSGPQDDFQEVADLAGLAGVERPVTCPHCGHGFRPVKGGLFSNQSQPGRSIRFFGLFRFRCPACGKTGTHPLPTWLFWTYVVFALAEAWILYFSLKAGWQEHCVVGWQEDVVWWAFILVPWWAYILVPLTAYVFLTDLFARVVLWERR